MFSPEAGVIEGVVYAVLDEGALDEAPRSYVEFVTSPTHQVPTPAALLTVQDEETEPVNVYR